METEEQTDDTPSYTLLLQGEGVTLERRVTKEVALAVINVALGGGLVPRPPAGRAGGQGGQPGGGEDTAGDGERLTPGEFIESVNARTNAEKIVAFGAFLNPVHGEGDFSREDIRGAFRAAHEPAPANFGRDFRAALSSNWIAEDGSTDRYFVTTTGRKAVADKFESARKRKPRRKARASSASSGSDEA